MLTGSLCLCLLALVCVLYAQEYPPIDGRGNNRNAPLQGSQYQPLPNVIGCQPSFSDGISQVYQGPSTRLISNRLCDGASPEVRGLSDLHSYWGQFLAHDIIHTRHGASADTLSIDVPSGDLYFDPLSTGSKTINILRSNSTGGSGGQVLRPVNHNTAYIDASMIYGSDSHRATVLRNDTHPQYMKVGPTIGGRPLLPYNTFGLENDNDPGITPDDELFVAGDVRSNENPILTSLHCVFLREHNRWVDILAEDHPDYSPETLYQEARKRVIAVIQSISLNEYVAVTLGEPLPLYSGYDPSIDASVGNFFGTVGFRYGHSETNTVALELTQSGENLTPIVIREAYFDPKYIEATGTDPILLGSTAQRQQEVDTFIVDDLRNFLFGNPGSGGLDLAAINMMRARDHGSCLYNDAREAYGLPRITSFDEISADPEINQIFADIYGDVDLIESYIGGLAETHLEASTLGPLFSASLRDQYLRLREGDRFHYRGEAMGFTEEEIDEFDRTTIADVILRNTELTAFPCSAFFYTFVEYDCGSGANSGPNTPIGPTGNNTASFLNGDITVSWNVNDDETISFTVAAQTTGWVAMALASNAGSMLGADAWVGTVEDGRVTITDSEISARQAGCPGVCPDTSAGGSDDLFGKSGSEENGVTTISFTRRFNTGDSLDQTIVEGQESDVLFAYGSSDNLNYHGSNKEAATINFFTGETSTVAFEENSAEDRLTVHGVMMFIGWGVVFPFGIFVARFVQFYIPCLLKFWFHIHLIVQYLGVLFIITGFVLAVEATAALMHDHFENTHAILGLTTFCLSIFVPAFGQITAIFWKVDGGCLGSVLEKGRFCGTRLFPDAVHYVTGYLSPIFAFITLFYGLHEHDADWWWYLLLALWIAFITILFIILLAIQTIMRCFGRDDDDESSVEAESQEGWSDDE